MKWELPVLECSEKPVCDGKNLEIITYMSLIRKWLNEIFSQYLQAYEYMFKIFLFSKHEIFPLKNDAGSVYLAEGMACAKALRQDLTFPMKKQVKAWLLLWRPRQFWASLCLKVCSKLPLRPWERPFTEPWEGLLGVWGVGWRTV